jgi:hypothetical protein
MPLIPAMRPSSIISSTEASPISAPFQKRKRAENDSPGGAERSGSIDHLVDRHQDASADPDR